MPTCVSESGSINATITPFVTGDGYDYANAAYANGQFVGHFDIVCNTKQIRIIANNNSATRTLFVDISQNSIITTDTISPTTSYDQTYSVNNGDYVEVYTNFGAGSVAANTFTGSVEIQSSTPTPTATSTPTPTPAPTTTPSLNLWLWGMNSGGGLGDNSQVNRSSPVQTIALGSNWVSVSGSADTVASGETLSAGIKSDGTLWIWGFNYNGSLGTNSAGSRSSPVQTVAGGTNWRSVVCSETNYSIATKTDGTWWGWGSNGSGQLGQVTDTAHRSSPVLVSADASWTSNIAVGSAFSLAIKNDGTLWGTGLNSATKQFVTTFVNTSSIVQVGLNSNWSQITAGRQFITGIQTNGTIWSWGNNLYGQIGNNTSGNIPSSPVQIGSGTNWSKVVDGANHSIALKSDGTIWCWGRNNNGQLGDGTVILRSSPVQVGTATNWIDVSAAATFSYALKSDNTLWLWGLNTQGQLGQNSVLAYSSPIQVVSTNLKFSGRDNTKSNSFAISISNKHS
jgi:alpha-tubulin suppressor-like RCC1 family protein